MPTKPKTPICTPAQRRQRELAWLLFITEGYAANVAHALTVNAYTMDRADLALMQQAEAHARATGTRLRKALGHELRRAA